MNYFWWNDKQMKILRLVKTFFTIRQNIVWHNIAVIIIVILTQFDKNLEKRRASARITMASNTPNSSRWRQIETSNSIVSKNLEKYNSTFWLQLVKLKIRFLARCCWAGSMLLSRSRKNQNWHSIKILSGSVLTKMQTCSC